MRCECLKLPTYVAPHDDGGQPRRRGPGRGEEGGAGVERGGGGEGPDEGPEANLLEGPAYFFFFWGGDFSFSALKTRFFLRWSREDGLQGHGDQQRGDLSAQGPPQGGEEEGAGGGGGGPTTTPPPLLVESAVAKKDQKMVFLLDFTRRTSAACRPAPSTRPPRRGTPFDSLRRRSRPF